MADGQLAPGRSRDTIERPRRAPPPGPDTPSGRPRRAKGRPCGFPGAGKGLNRAACAARPARPGLPGGVHVPAGVCKVYGCTLCQIKVKTANAMRPGYVNDLHDTAQPSSLASEAAQRSQPLDVRTIRMNAPSRRLSWRTHSATHSRDTHPAKEGRRCRVDGWLPSAVRPRASRM